jgi:peptidoglycan/LPS O-acetylase OafA/YrhL
MGGTSQGTSRLDLLRLCLAALVLVSHSFDLSGHFDEEPLRRVTGDGFGGLGVCGFFALSGYLISRSWATRPDLLIYLRNRLLRIAPAYVVAFAISVLLVGAITAPDVGRYFARLRWPLLGFDALSLRDPEAPSIAPFPVVNGSMWTIRYEFICYLLAPLATLNRWTLAAAWAGVAVWQATTSDVQVGWALMFLSGAAFYVFGAPRAGVKATIALAMIAATLMLFPKLALLGLSTAGTYALISFGLGTVRWRAPDISYGTYLYGWPIQKLLIFGGVTQPWLVLALATPLALACGAASWFLIERHALALKRREPGPLAQAA